MISRKASVGYGFQSKRYQCTGPFPNLQEKREYRERLNCLNLLELRQVCFGGEARLLKEAIAEVSELLLPEVESHKDEDGVEFQASDEHVEDE